MSSMPATRQGQRCQYVSPPRTGERSLIVLLDPAKTMSGRSRFFCTLAATLQRAGYRVAFAYPGNAVMKRHYLAPAGIEERTLRRCGKPPGNNSDWVRWTPAKPQVICRSDLAEAVRTACLVIVPATVDIEVAEALRSTRGFRGCLLLTDHTGARLVGDVKPGQLCDSYTRWLQMADGVHTVAEGLATSARKNGARNVFVIPPAIDERAFVSPLVLACERIVRRRTAILAPGALLAAKGFGSLLHAFASVAAAYPEWRLDIFGDGPEREELEALRDELGIASSAVIHGFDPDLVTIYRRYPIVASATAFESRPMVLDESMASGCVAVFPASSGGPAQIISDGNNGLLSKSNLANDLRDTLMLAIERFQFDREWWRKAQNEAIRTAHTAHPRVVDESWRILVKNLIRS